MNINEFLAFRKKCFFCEEELVVNYELSDSTSRFILHEGNIFFSASRLHLILKLETEELILPDHIGPELKVLLKNGGICISKECPKCQLIRDSNFRFKQHYEYKGKFSFDEENKKIKEIIFFEERLWSNFGVYGFNNDFINKNSSIKINNHSTSYSYNFIKIDHILDLNKYTPESLERKFRTLALLS